MTRVVLDLNDCQITKLRELMDALPLAAYHDLILPVLKALPLESVAGSTSSSADADRQALLQQGLVGSSFSLHAFTEKGKAALPAIARLFEDSP